MVSAGACALLRERLAWRELAYPPLILLPAMVSVTGFWLFATSDLLAGWGTVAWPAAVLTQYGLLWRFDAEWSRATPWYHCGTLWLGVFLGGWEGVWLVDQHLPEPWSFSAAALVPACVVWGFASLGARLQWPVQRHREVYLGAGQLPLVVGVAAWMLAASFVDGDPGPLAYVPLLNPVEMVQAISLVALFRWCSTGVVDASDGFRLRMLGFLGFVALNGVLARMTHHFLDVPFEAGALLSSGTFQALLSFVWTTAACVVIARCNPYEAASGMAARRRAADDDGDQTAAVRSRRYWYGDADSVLHRRRRVHSRHPATSRRCRRPKMTTQRAPDTLGSECGRAPDLLAG